MSMKQAYEKKLQSQLKEWDAEIDRLSIKADKADVDIRQEYYKQMDEIRSNQQEARERLEELRRTDDDAWEDLKAGIESAWFTLGESVRSATARFK